MKVGRGGCKVSKHAMRFSNAVQFLTTIGFSTKGNIDLIINPQRKLLGYKIFKRGSLLNEDNLEPRESVLKYQFFQLFIKQKKSLKPIKNIKISYDVTILY